jgi:hypothetical protein
MREISPMRLNCGLPRKGKHGEPSEYSNTDLIPGAHECAPDPGAGEWSCEDHSTTSRNWRKCDVRAHLGPDRWALAHAAGRSTSIDALLKDIDSALKRHARA